jgi:hypothetical protein
MLVVVGLWTVTFVSIWKTCCSWGRLCLCGTGDLGTVEFCPNILRF